MPDKIVKRSKLANRRLVLYQNAKDLDKVNRKNHYVNRYENLSYITRPFNLDSLHWKSLLRAPVGEVRELQWGATSLSTAELHP
jgi:hypothetical protein